MAKRTHKIAATKVMKQLGLSKGSVVFFDSVQESLSNQPSTVTAIRAIDEGKGSANWTALSEWMETVYDVIEKRGVVIEGRHKTDE